MEERVFFLRVIRYAIIGVILFTGICASCTGYESYLVKELIRNGQEPMSAMCAITPKYSGDKVCAMLMAKTWKD